MPKGRSIILVLAANPRNTQWLRLDQEVREISTGLRRAKNKYILKQHWAVRPIDVRRALLDHRPEFVHFCGHGRGNEGIAFEDEEGDQRLVSTDSLTGLFKLFSNDVRCVVLNACYSEVQAKAIAKHIDYVIGMSEEIGDKAAIEFSVAFYDAIGAGERVEFAYELGCNAIHMAGLKGYKIPVLIKRSPKENSLQYNDNSQESELDVENYQIYRNGVTEEIRKTKEHLFLETLTDWGEAPDIESFVGRIEELNTLKTWILDKKSKIVLIKGIGGTGKTNLSLGLTKGGIGKTDLSIRLAEEIRSHFSFVIWRSLINAPSLNELLTDIIDFLANDKKSNQNESYHIKNLIKILQRKPCLLLFDNLETILRSGGNSGEYRDGYEEYGELFNKLGKIIHKSCVIITSREIPREISLMEYVNEKVKIMHLGGLDYQSAKKIIAQHGALNGSDSDLNHFISYYNGNPLAIELAIKHIKEVYSGDLNCFIQDGKPICRDIRELLDWHLNRLSQAEKEVLNWLAINREPMSKKEIEEDILQEERKRSLGSTIQSLRRRLPIETVGKKITLQPVLLEHLTDRLIDNYVEELTTPEKIDVFAAHAIVKATSKDYIRTTQYRVLVEPVLRLLRDRFKDASGIEERLKEVCRLIHNERATTFDYTAGNLLNMLTWLGADLTGLDLSGLSIIQAYLVETALIKVDMTESFLSRCVFRQTFGKILSLSIAPGGNIIAAGDSLGFVRLIEVNGRPHLSIPAHSDWVRCVKFSADGKTLVSAGDDAKIKFWSIPEGGCLRIFETQGGWVRDLALTRDNRFLFSAGDDFLIRIWEVSTERCIRILKEHKSKIHAIALDSEEKLLATAGEDGAIRLWNLEKGHCVFVLHGHKGAVRALAFNPKKHELLSGGDDGKVISWDVEKGSIMTVFDHHKSWIRAIKFIGVDQNFVTASDDKTIALCNRTDKNSKISFLLGHSSRIQALDYFQLNNLLVSGGDDQKILIWKLNDKKCINTIRGYTNSIRAIIFNANNEELIAGGEDGIVRIWNLKTGEYNEMENVHKGMVLSISVDPRGEKLVSASDDQTVIIWDLCKKKPYRILQGHQNWVYSVTFDMSGKYIASGSEDGTIRIWIANSGKCIKIIKAEADWIRSVDFAPNSLFVSSGSRDNLVRIWDIKTGNCIQKLAGHHNEIWAVRYSHDGQFIASASDDATIRIWDVNSGKCLQVLKGHDSRVRSLDFDHKMNYLVSGSDDHTLRLWDPLKGRCLRAFQGHEDRVRCVHVSPDSTMIASGSEDTTCRIWSMEAEVCNRVIQCPRPYEGLRISGVKGISQNEKTTLLTLGATE